ncbi:TPA: hypothetical protein ACNO4K_004589 [Salmonella enterica subsp. enterica serovar Newport]
MDGFAQGLLAGFSTVDNAMQNRKALSLREAALAQQQKNADRNYELAQDEFGYRRESDQRNFDSNNEHWNKTFQANQSYRGSLLANAAQQLKMQKETHDSQMNNARYQQRIQQYTPQMNMAQQAIQAGDYEAAKNIMADVPDDVPLARILKDPKYAQSTVSAGQKLYGIMSSPDAHKDPMTTLHSINENMSDISPLFQTEADRAVGQVDPKTGQKIVSAQVHHIAPVPDRNDPKHHSADDVAVFVKVKYANGKEAIKPVTENRSSDLRDNVKRVSIHGLLDTASSRVEASHNYLQYLQQPQGLSKADIQKEEAKIYASAARGATDGQVAVDQFEASIGIPGAKERAQQTQAKSKANELLNDPEIAGNPDAVHAVNRFLQNGNTAMLTKDNVLAAASRNPIERKKQTQYASNKETASLIKTMGQQRLPPIQP